MLAVSNAFNEAFKSDLREVKMRIKVNDVTYTDEDIVSFNYNAGSIVGESFAIGSTFANTIKLTLCKIVEGLKQLDEVIPEMGIVLPDGSTEFVKLGTFIISEEVNPDRNENRTSLECTDKMIMLDDSYVSKLKYPAKIRDVALEIANLAGVEVDKVSFGRLMENTIKEPKGYTYRQALGLIAQFEAGYVCFDRNGLLSIRQLEDKNYKVTPNEYFQNGLNKNELMFRPAGIEVRISEDSDKVIKIGNEKGSVIRLENRVMTEQLLRLVYEKIKNINYYPYTLKWRGNPAVEVGDWLLVDDTRGNVFKVPNLSYSFEYKGGLVATSTVETVASNEVRMGYKGMLNQVIEYVNDSIKDIDGVEISYGVEEPPNPKEGDVWFKYDGPDTILMIYEKIGEPDIFDWVPKISSAVDETVKDKIKELEEDSKQNQLEIDNALKEAEKARKEAFDSTVISKQAEKDALNAIAKGEGNSTEITRIDGQQKLTNTKVEGNTANILSLQTDSERLSLSIGKVKNDVDNLDTSSRNLIQNTTNFEPLPPTNAIDSCYTLSKKGNRLRIEVDSSYAEGKAVKFKLSENIKPNTFVTIRFNAFVWTLATKFRFKMSYGSPTGWQKFPVSAQNTDFSITFNVGNITENNWFWLETDKTFEIEPRSFVVTNSNTKPSWSPAPEDLTTKSEFATFEATMKGFQQTVNSDIDGVKSQQTQMAGQITQTIKDVDGNKSQITQLKSDINLRVEKANVIAQINLSPEAILIQAKRIHLSGESLIDNAVIKNAMIADSAITDAKIQNATISNAKIISVNANKVIANTLSALTTNTGTLNITGWMNILTENMGIRGTYDFTDNAEVVYPRRYEGEFRLSHRHLFFNARADKINANGSIGAYHGYGESFYGANYFKSRWYTKTVDGDLLGRIDIRDDFIQVSNSWAENEMAGTLIKPKIIYTEEINVQEFTARTTGSNIYFNRNRTDLADFRIGLDGSGKLIQSKAVYDRTYNAQAQLCITAEGNFGRIVSARKYKTDIQVAHDLIDKAKTVLDINPSSWLDKQNPSKRHYGFIADEFDELNLKEVVIYNNSHEVEGLSYDRISTYHNVILKEHEREIKELNNKILLLEEKLNYAG